MGRRKLPSIPTEQEPLKIPPSGRLPGVGNGSAGSFRVPIPVGSSDESLYTSGIDLRGSGPFPMATPNGHTQTSHMGAQAPLIDQLRYFAEQSKSLSEADVGSSKQRNETQAYSQSSSAGHPTADGAHMVVVEAQKLREWRHGAPGEPSLGYRAALASTTTSSTPDLSRTAISRAGGVSEFGSADFGSFGKSGKYFPQNKMPATLARVLLKQELKEALSTRKRQIEACEIEANQREYAVHRMLISGLIPDKPREPDNVPRVVKCSLPPELVAGVKIVRKDPRAQKVSQHTSSSYRTPDISQDTELGRNFTSQNRTPLLSTMNSKSAGVQTSTSDMGTSSIAGIFPVRTNSSYQQTSSLRSKKKVLPSDPSQKDSLTNYNVLDWTSSSHMPLSIPTSSSKLFHPKPMKNAETQTAVGVSSAHTRSFSPSKYIMAPKVTERNSISTSSAFQSRYPMLDFGRETDEEFRISRPRTKSIGTGTSEPCLYDGSLYSANLKRSKKTSRSAATHRRLMSTYFSDDDDPIAREAKKLQLKEEIARRRQKLASHGDLLDMRLYPQAPVREPASLRPHALASDYSSHIPHYGSLPRVDFPSSSFNDFPSPSTAPLPPHAKPPLSSAALGASLFNETATSLPPLLYPPTPTTLYNSSSAGGGPPIPVSGAGHLYDPAPGPTSSRSGGLIGGNRLANGFLPPGIRSQHSDLGRAFLEAKEEFEQKKRLLEENRAREASGLFHHPLSRLSTSGKNPKYYDLPPHERQFHSLPRNFDQIWRSTGGAALSGDAQQHGPPQLLPAVASAGGGNRLPPHPLGHPLPVRPSHTTGIDQYATLRPHNKLHPMYRSMGADLDSYYGRVDSYGVNPAGSGTSYWPPSARDPTRRQAFGADPYSSSLSRSLPAMTDIDRFYDPLSGYSASDPYGAPRSPYTADYGFKDYSTRDPYGRPQPRWYDSLPGRSANAAVPYSSAPYSANNSYSTIDPRYTTAGLVPTSSGPSLLSQYANYLNRDFQNRPSATNDYYSSATYGPNLYSAPVSGAPSSMGYSSYNGHPRQIDPAYSTARNHSDYYGRRTLVDDRFQRPASMGAGLEQAGLDYGRSTWNNAYSSGTLGRSIPGYPGMSSAGYGYSSTPPGYSSAGYSSYNTPVSGAYGNYNYQRSYSQPDAYSHIAAVSSSSTAPSMYQRTSHSNPSASSNPPGTYATLGRGGGGGAIPSSRYPTETHSRYSYPNRFTSGSQSYYQDEWGSNALGSAYAGYPPDATRRSAGYYGPTGSLSDYAPGGAFYSTGATSYYPSYTNPPPNYCTEYDRQTDIL